MIMKMMIIIIIKDQNVHDNGVEIDDDGDDVTESEESVEDLSIVEFNSIEIKERFIKVNILCSN